MSNDPLVRGLVKLLCQLLLRPAVLSAARMACAAISSQATLLFTANGIRVPVLT